MKILWITNIEFPEVSQIIDGKGSLKSSGGWLLGAAKALTESSTDYVLTVATVSKRVRALTLLKGEKIAYYLIPYGKGNLKPNPEYEPIWKIINEEVNPDIVHIHGTELSHGLAFVNACGANNVVVSIQGLKTACYKYFNLGLSVSDILLNLTLHDILKGSLLEQKRAFQKQSLYEIELLKKVKHIIGRTSWDKAQAWSINHNAEYHFCNETLRDVFYDGSRWCYDKCKKHTIFLSQAGYPLKGAHQVLKAMPIILRDFPDASIRISGADITDNKGFHGLTHYIGYGKIIHNLIDSLGLGDKVVFTGSLDAEQMKNEYLRCNVFICPSAIENSPNSLGEAQILGTPVIASYVGGIPDMMFGHEECMYRFEDVEMLAYKVCEVFKNEVLPPSALDMAQERHNKTHNLNKLLEIYTSIINKY